VNSQKLAEQNSNLQTIKTQVEDLYLTEHPQTLKAKVIKSGFGMGFRTL